MAPIQPKTPTTQVANPTRRPINLPNEIFHMILDCLGNHKPTLAKCMRVSLQLYHLVAPRLYTHVDWSGGRSFPLFLPPNSQLLLNRVSPLKSDLFQLIRSFNMGAHSKYRCCPSFPVNFQIPRLKTLFKVPVLKYNIFGKAVSQTHQNHIDTPSSRCQILGKIAPAKLVIHASYTEPLPIQYIDRGDLTKIVSYLGLVPLPFASSRIKQKRQPFSNKSPIRKQVVYIIAKMDADGAQPQPSSRPDPLVCFREHLMEVLYKPNFPLNVYVVNAVDRAMESAGKIGYSCEKRFAALVADIRKHEKLEVVRVREYWKSRKGGGTPSYKTVSAVEQTVIHFLDSREYIEQWDTNGEFTDEERIWYMGKRS